MDIGFAIRILDPETSAETLAEIEYYAGFRGEEAVTKAVDNACILGVAALRAQDERKWIPVTERLPEDDLPKDTKKKMIRCLVYTNKGTIKPCVRQRWEVNGELVPWEWNKDLFAKPTHWMYYPQPPKGE